MAEKQRQVVPGLGDLPQLQPASDPRALDSYVRPGETQYGRPTMVNPFEQLSEALAKLDPTMQRGVNMLAEQYGAEEIAKGEKEFWENREKWNAEIRAGRLPEGASPYFQRGLQRAALKQQAADFYAQTHAEFFGQAGAEARASNDPAVMQKFLNDQQAKFRQSNLKSGDKDLFSTLDMQDIFNPFAEQTYKTMLQTHASYRVAEREKEYEELATAQIDASVTRNLAQIQPTDSDEVRAMWIAQAAREANDVLYNQDTGIVKNGMLASKGNQILIDTITTKMMKTGNRSWGDVLHYVTNKDGAPIANTQYAQAKILAAEEHITDQMIKEAHFKEFQDGLQLAHLQRLRAPELMRREDERYDREWKAYQESQGTIAKDEIVNTSARRVFEGLRNPDPKRGTEIIDQAIRNLEQIPGAWKDAEHLRNMVHTMTKIRMDYEEDGPTVANLRAKISTDPLSTQYDEIVAAVKNQAIKPTTAMQMMDDLDRNRQNGDHDYMRQPFWMDLNKEVRQAMADKMGDNEFGEGAIRAGDASAELRDEALTWLQEHPQGSVEAFRKYMRSIKQDLIERHNPSYGAEQQRNRANQEKAGRQIQQITSADVEQKRLEEADKQAEQKKKADAEQKRQQRQQEIESGQRTKEGRKILRLPDGSIETEKTATIQDDRINDGRPTNIPTIYDGKHVTEKEAIEIIAKSGGVDPDTGRKLRGYYSINDAVIAARERSARLGKEYGHTPDSSTKLTPDHLRTLLTTKEKVEIADLQKRFLNPGTAEKPVSKEQVKDRVMEILAPHYKGNGQGSADLAEGVDQFMSKLFPTKKKEK